MKHKFTAAGEELNNMPVENDPVKDFFYFVWDLLKTGIIVFIIAFAIRYFLIQPFIVEGGSMLPNYIDKEYLLAEKLSYSIGNPHRGDVVIFKYPKNPSVNYIKRIIGLPGETVEVKDNQVVVKNSQHPDGVVINESYLGSGTKTEPLDYNNVNITLGTNDYFVLGDNREHSSDSREWGILPKANIIGRSWLAVKPANMFGIEKRVSYPELSKLILEQFAYLKGISI